MKRWYYVVFSMPCFFLLTVLLVPNLNNFGGPWVMLGLLLIVLSGASSVILTFVGIFWVLKNFEKKKSILEPCIATVLAACGGIWLMHLIQHSR